MPRLIVILVMLFSTGCVFHQPRPVAGPADRPLAAAGEIVGRYRDNSEFRWHLRSNQAIAMKDALDCRISLNGASNGTITVEKDGVAVDTWRFVFDIQDGWLRASGAPAIQTGEQAIITRKNIRLFIRPSIHPDGLVIRYMESNIGLVMLIPALVKDEAWFSLTRIPPMNATP